MRQDRTHTSVSNDGAPAGLTLLHIALQGRLRARNVAYGITPDTGGHIRYLLELADALGAEDGVAEVIVATRAFGGPGIASVHGLPEERRGRRVRIWRIPTRCPGDLPKEALAGELAGFGDGLLARLAAEGVRPDAVHAHYADAAVPAERVRDALDIPLLFTAHSLGAVKAETLAAPPCPVLRRRIAVETQALHAADAVIASSTDEREGQWSLYRGAEAVAARGTIHVLAPGCATGRLRRKPPAARAEAVDRVIRRFLHDPDLPPVLALSRPVRKKNLGGLIEAFAQGGLRDRANLVVFAGARGDVRGPQDEQGEVCRELLMAIDGHDLWGSVAVPKVHAPADVPAIYRWAAERGGVFANLAFNEPFGLTLLEAAAAGLPVVATAEGGSRDIVRRLGNGALVDPRDADGAAKAMARLIEDRGAWTAAREAGRRRVGAFSWRAHARAYLALVRGLIARGRPALPAVVRRERRDAPSALLVSDVDATLTGDARALADFRHWRAEHPHVAFAIATGRSLPGARETLAEWSVPEPDLFVTSVGANIDRFDRGGARADSAWADAIRNRWDRDRAAAVLATIPDLRLQPEAEQGPAKLSVFTPPDPGIAGRVRRALAEAGCAATVIHSHGVFLDVLPPRASKGYAALRLARLLGVPPGRLIAAGDSGNDAALLAAAARPILVANRLPESDDLAARHRGVYLSRLPHAAGVVDGAGAALRAMGIA